MRDHKDATDLVVKPIVIDRAAFNQGQNAQYEPHIEETEVMDSLVARGPHAVGQPIPFRKSKRACSTTDNETWVEADASNTLNNFDLGDTRTTHAVVEPIGFAMREDATNGTFDVKQVDTSLCLQALRPAVTSHHAQNIVVQPFAWTQNQREEVRILGDKTGALALPGTHQSNYIAEPQVYENHPNDSRITGPLDVAPTVVSRFGTGGGNVPLVSQEPHIVQASELRLRGQITEQETVPTLLANTKSGDNDPLAVHPVAFQPGNLRRQGGADPSTEVFPTLTKDSGDQSPHVAHPVVPLDGMNLLSRLGPCSDEHSIQNFTPGDPSFTLKKGGNQHGVFTPMAVRRLTPVECERLQGFPDNWSRISWKGKPEDQCPDGPRYKACGNSMAVPVMRWIGERIAQADAKHFPPTP
jgi:site-specific DNA-cytosine methylase